ncbi:MULTISPECIES: hypothetical protein [Crossiella]|uniref:Uncharacterized protein n=1 Tax=Crossiella cryophila TaxID=43355 RepID=A0A7W7CB52_9PSEU|nr:MULTISPECIES: hypothetical protein [Crossiella]MBB4677762.1 hypothetical protein [Crossiella cryophila]MCK2242668.1 hypothetical protein [Crossiella sp. S99.2]MCK2256545.1 hypothetical protein [Crossiella sp. S99.1]
MSVQHTLFSHPTTDQPHIAVNLAESGQWAHDTLFHEPVIPAQNTEHNS